MLQDFKSKKIGIMELMSYGVKVFRGNSRYILLTALAAYVPMNVLLGFIPMVSTADLQAMLTVAPEDILSQYSYLFLYMALSAVTIILFQPLAIGGVTYIAGQALEGKPITLPGILDASTQKWHRYLLTALMYDLVLSFSFILIVPAIYFGIMFYAYANVVATSNKFGFAALKESRRIIKGNFWSSLIFVVYMSALTSISGIIISSPIVTVGANLVFFRVLGAIIADSLCIYFSLVTALWFFNLKLLRPDEGDNA